MLAELSQQRFRPPEAKATKAYSVATLERWYYACTAGLEPFRELRRHGLLPLGGAVLTGPSRLPIKAIIPVAGIDLTWRSSEVAIRNGVQNAMELARVHQFQSIAFPLIGAGTGGVEPKVAEDVLLATLADLEFDGEVRVVCYPARTRAPSLRVVAASPDPVSGEHPSHLGAIGQGDEVLGSVQGKDGSENVGGSQRELSGAGDWGKSANPLEVAA